MEQDTQNLEQKLKLENDISIARKELKNTLSHLGLVKSEYNGIVELIDKNKKLLEQQKNYLQTVLNDIATSKIAWSQEQNVEKIKLDEKNSAADNILNRKRELNEQEETIRNLLLKDEKVLNENKQLEFKLSQDNTAIEVEKNKVKNMELDISRREEKLSKDIQDFKEKVGGVLQEVEKI